MDEGGGGGLPSPTGPLGSAELASCCVSLPSAQLPTDGGGRGEMARAGGWEGYTFYFR